MEFSRVTWRLQGALSEKLAVTAAAAGVALLGGGFGTWCRQSFTALPTAIFHLAGKAGVAARPEIGATIEPGKTRSY